jgi:hypothetical protein
MEALKAELCAMAAQGNFANAIDRMMGIVLGLEQENERMSDLYGELARRCHLAASEVPGHRWNLRASGRDCAPRGRPRVSGLLCARLRSMRGALSREGFPSAQVVVKTRDRS